MLTIQLNIREVDKPEVLAELQAQSSACTIWWFNHLELKADKKTKEGLSKKFPLLGSRMLEACCKRAEEIFASHEAKKKELSGKITKLEAVKNLDAREQFKVFKKIAKYKKALNSSVVFGGKKNLQRLTYLCNIGDEQQISEARNTYKTQRNLGWVNEGEVSYRGNRHIDFSKIKDGYLIIKVNKKNFIRLDINLPKKCENLFRVCEAGVAKTIPIKAVVKGLKVYLSYDNQKLAGFHFKKQEWSKALKEIPKEDKEQRTAITRKFYEEQRLRMLSSKNENRVVAVDLNPERIGYSIMEMTDRGYRRLRTGVFELSKIVNKVKTGQKNSAYKKQMLSIAINKLFKIATHYGCSQFALEDLNFEHEVFNRRTRQFNRLTKNLWDRSYTEQQITKRCQNYGIFLQVIPPEYSSFVGNLLFRDYDPAAAASEIGRRSISWMFIKKHGKVNLPSPLTWMPTLSKENLPGTMKDVPESVLKNVGSAFRYVRTAGLRYRWSKRSTYSRRLDYRNYLADMLHYSTIFN